MTKESLSRRSREELIELAKALKIVGRSAMTKSRLIAVILATATRRGARSQAAKPARRIEAPGTPAKRAPARVATTEATVAAGATAGAGRASSVVAGMQQAAESKFYLGERAEAVGERSREAPSRPAAAEPRYELPHRYGDHRIILMVRDPWWVYAYWEIDPGQEQALRTTIKRQGEEPAGSCLRVYDVTDIEFRGDNAHRSFDLELTGMADNWYIHVEHPNRSYIVDIGIKSRSGRFYTLARSNQVRTPRFGPSDQIDEEWMCPDDDFWKMFGIAGGFGIGKSSMEMKELFEKRWREEVSSGAVSSLFSPGMARGKGRRFWMRVETELIVYGATEPDAKVTVQGKPIALRPDGTFTLRFALPDGRQEIPVAATSADNEETQAVTPIVTRKTV